MSRYQGRRVIRAGILAVAGFVVLALALDGLAALLQPALDSEGTEGVLRTTDAEGTTHETRLAVFEDGDGTIWVQSGHHFRGWYERLKHDPDVEFVRNGAVNPYRAVPLDTPEAALHVRGLIRDRVGVVGFWTIRAFLLFAEIKPVRLDPR